MKSVLVIAPHPDDETLGCGGALLRHIAEGMDVHWLIVTCISTKEGYDLDQVDLRATEIDAVAKAYGFESVNALAFPTAKLDAVPREQLIADISRIVSETKPQIVYMPFRGDAHSDHSIVFDASIASTKSFRFRFIESLRVYETISETDAGLGQKGAVFVPNLYVDISGYLEKKLEILAIYSGEVLDFPFPRSITAVTAKSQVRGAEAFRESAESFMIIRDIV